MFEVRDIDLFRFTPSLVLVGGSSGIGKTSIVDALIQSHADLYVRPRSYTSRDRRPNETTAEYSFVDRNEIHRMYERGDVLTVDEVYRNSYAISRKSVDGILEGGKIAIKEVHPVNHAKIQRIVRSTVSVVLFAVDYPSSAFPQEKYLRRERRREDIEYYSTIDPLAFDIPLRVDPRQPIEVSAQNLHLSIYSRVLTYHYFPNPPLIDETNMRGYTKAAPEFLDKHRITTRNFHDLSHSCFADAVSRYITRGMRCIELGVGQGWLSRILPMAEIDYTGIDISSEMIRRSGGSNSLKSSARYMSFPDRYFDVAVASLADPYCYPAALCEIRRVLKPDGLFIFSSPSRCWSDGIRAETATTKTGFTMSDGSEAEVYSFTFTANELRQLLSICGFSVLDCRIASGEHLRRLPTEEVSPAIRESARNLGVDISRLPILNFVIARREK